MKKTLLIFVLITLFFPYESFSQAQFETGKIGINLSNGGRLRIFAPTVATRQIDRSSILVGMDQTHTFDYYEDGELEDSAILFTTPFSDFAAYGATNNTYNDPPLPPAVTSRLYVFGWTDQAYLLVKNTIINRETATFSAIIGMEIIPQLGGVYGNELVTCDVVENLVISSIPGHFVGYKLLGEQVYSSLAIDWYDGYQADTSYYTWLHTPPTAYSLQSGGDGAVAFFAKNPTNISANDSGHMYFAVAYGTTESEMRTNINAAVLKYNTLVSVDEPGNTIPNKFSLLQNYPNPFNPTTQITFTLPHSDFVTLKVYDVLGNEVAELTNEFREAGSYNVIFNAKNFSSGTYFYKLSNSQGNLINKMLLIK
ncbi:MAG: T9SS type A sorting domain-containing protein [Ignavibacteriaceae bacterium]